MIVDPHYVWALGHATVLINSAYVMLQTLLFRTPVRAYRLLYVGALVSYAIVVLKSLGKPRGVNWLRRAFVDENFQYGLLALYWLISKPINITILPFATFSLFHCATFLRTNVLPKFYAKAPAAANANAAATPNWAESAGRRIQTWVKGNYDKAMNFVAWAELVIFARVLLGGLAFQNSFVAPIFVAHFLRLRYHQSQFTKAAVDGIGARIDGVAAKQSPAVQNAWGTAKRVVRTWGGGNLVGNRGTAPAARPTGPAAGAAGAGAQARATGVNPAPGAAGAAGATRRT